MGYLAVQQECVLRDFITVSLGSFLQHCCDLMSAQLWISLTWSTAKKRQLDDESERPIEAAITNLANRGTTQILHRTSRGDHLKSCSHIRNARLVNQILTTEPLQDCLSLRRAVPSVQVVPGSWKRSGDYTSTHQTPSLIFRDHIRELDCIHRIILKLTAKHPEISGSQQMGWQRNQNSSSALYPRVDPLGYKETHSPTAKASSSLRLSLALE